MAEPEARLEQSAANASAASARQRPLSRRVLVAYSALTLPIAALGLPITVYLPPFYAEELGLSLATVGLVFTLTRVWDLLTDPLMGVIVDRYDSRWGRYRHWIVLAVPLLCLATWYVYMPDPAQVSAAYLLGWMLVLYVGFTLLAISHQSWGAELAVSYDERARLFGWREIFITAGMVGVLAMPAVIERTVEGGEASFAKVASMGVFMLVLLPVTAAGIVFGVPDRRVERASSAMPWRQSLSLMLRNRLLRRLLLADVLSGLGVGITGSLYIFLVEYVFQLKRIASLGLLAYFVAGFICMPLWMHLAYRWGKHVALMIAMAYGVAVQFGMWVLAEPGRPDLLWSFTILYGVAFGAAPALLRALMADAVDADELQTGRRRAGLFFALLTTTNKVGGALAVGVTYLVLELGFGFQPGVDNTRAAEQGVLHVYVLGSSLGMALAGLLMVRYPLDRQRHAEIREALEARERAAYG